MDQFSLVPSSGMIGGGVIGCQVRHKKWVFQANMAILCLTTMVLRGIMLPSIYKLRARSSVDRAVDFESD